MAMIERKKMELTSMDVTEEKREELKQLFPEVFSDGIIDFDQFKRALGKWVEPSKEHFGLNWPGKSECIKIIQQPSIATLKPDRGESVNFDETENLFIEGENLEVLKLLQKSYFGKIKMIYIDPPYNTGNEFVYPDNYAETLDSYLAYTGRVDDEGRRLWSGPKNAINAVNSGRYHTRWLNMMYPRLYLSRNLLRQDGFILISIDDNEVSQLRQMCDNVFGEENFVDTVVWKKRYGGGPKEKYLVSLHEYVLVYAKDLASVPDIFVPLQQESIDRYYKNKDEYFETRGPYRTHPLEATKSFGERDNLKFPIEAPDKQMVYPQRQWLWEQKRVKLALSRNEIEFVKKSDGKWSVNSKQYLKDENGKVRKTKAFSIIEDVYTQHGTNEIVDLFGDAKIFDFPKPSKLIEQLLEISTSDSDNDIVLDFFAGSATTAHAVLNLNRRNGGNRKFIMVQLPEPCDAGSAAYKSSYETIADIGKDRIRKVAQKLTGQKGTEFDFDGSQSNDIGFKVFKLGSSNFRIWNGNIDDDSSLEEHLDLHVEHVSKESSSEDILYELLLKAGFPLTTKVKKVKMVGKQVFSIQSGSMLICLEKEVTSDLIDAMVDAEPMQVICLDEAFKGNDQLKTNAVQTFKACAKSQESEIVFKTV